MKNKLLVFVVLGSTLNAAALEHTVVKHENLSTLCWRLVPGPVWGKKGSLRTVLMMNPTITDRNRVFPGQIITFPDPLTPANAAVEPSPEELTTKTLASDDKPEFSPSSTLIALAGLEYFQISSKDKISNRDANFASNASPRLDLIWELQWTKDYLSRLSFTHVAESVMNDETSQRSLKHSNGGRTNVGAEILKRVTDTTSLGLFVARSTRTFSRAPSADALTLDRISGMEMGALVEKNILQLSKLGLNARARLGWLAPTEGAGYSVDSGLAASVGLGLRHELRIMTLEALTYYGYWQQDSKYSQQSSKQLGLSVGLSWRFDE